ncbi:MAG TPA: hypothetical protein PLX65_10335, partial [Accumulibacter sp.]|nr:hypothetical protein [Accumulibacter sp.]
MFYASRLGPFGDQLSDALSSIDVTAIVTACLEGAKAYHGQATYARVARLWIEAHPELSDPAERELMIDAAKLIEACRIKEAIEKYDQ